VTINYEKAAAFLAPRLWLALAAGVCVWGIWLGSLALGGWEFDLITKKPVGVDHIAFYSPARMILEGREADIYNHWELYQFQKKLFPEGRWEEFEAYRNPPFYALLYTATAWLPYWASCWIWAAIGLLLLVVGIRWLGAERPWVATAWVASFLPVFSAIGYGQNSLLSFGAFCACYRLLAMKRPFLAGLAASFLWFKPPLLLGLFFWWLLDVRRKWTCWLGVIAGGALLTGVTYPIVPNAWHGFVGTLASNAEFDNFDWWKMHNARAFWRLLLPDPVTLAEFTLPTSSPKTVTVTLRSVLWLVSAGAGAWCFVRVWLRQRDNLPVVFGASVFLMLWASPHSMIYEWASAAIPAVLWWTAAPRHRPALVVLYTVAWVALFAGTHIGQAQEMLQKELGLEQLVIIQVSDPLLGWVGWRAMKLFTAPDPDGSGQKTFLVVPDEGDRSHGQSGTNPAGSLPPAP
jgi:hypothetical protein